MKKIQTQQPASKSYGDTFSGKSSGSTSGTSTPSGGVSPDYSGSSGTPVNPDNSGDLPKSKPPAVQPSGGPVGAAQTFDDPSGWVNLQAYLGADPTMSRAKEQGSSNGLDQALYGAGVQGGMAPQPQTTVNPQVAAAASRVGQLPQLTGVQGQRAASSALSGSQPTSVAGATAGQATATRYAAQAALPQAAGATRYPPPTPPPPLGGLGNQGAMRQNLPANLRRFLGG